MNNHKVTVGETTYDVMVTDTHSTDDSLYVSVKEDGWKWVHNTKILKEVKDHISTLYSKSVYYITGTD